MTDPADVETAVADAHQSRGVGSTLAAELAADARAAGITRLTATVCGDNPRIVALLKRLGSLDMSWNGGERDSTRTEPAKCFHRLSPNGECGDATGALSAGTPEGSRKRD